MGDHDENTSHSPDIFPCMVSGKMKKLNNIFISPDALKAHVGNMEAIPNVCQYLVGEKKTII